VGKRPKQNAAADTDQLTQLVRLRREMKEAIAAEDYEQASKLRDEIKQIKDAG
jgi:protein-arginine kinase activator protein McsA